MRKQMHVYSKLRHIHLPAMHMLIIPHALYNVYNTTGISMDILDIKDNCCKLHER